MADRLDVLLEETRPPEPFDDGFSLLVMDRIRVDAERRSRRYRRFFTRPAVLAAAAVLVTGGALAAVSTVTAPDHDETSAPSPASVAREATDAPTAPEVTASVAEPNAPLSPVTAGEPTPGFAVYRNGDFEWGYTSAHAAYVLDHSTGLRLETESYTTSFEAGKPQKVTVTLANTGDQTLGIYSSDGCALLVGGFAKQQGDEAKSFDPTPSADDTQTESWRCAGTDTRTGGQAQKWVIAPGSSRTRHAEIVLTEPGTWSIVGLCRCELVDPDEGDPDPLTPLTQLLLGSPAAEGQGAQHSETPSYVLVTPPIEVAAR